MLIMELFKLPNSIENVLVHTDILRGFKFPSTDRNEFLDNHYKFIMNLIGDKNVFFPSFNYSCLTNGEYNVITDEVKVGLLNEYIRSNKNFTRSLMPVFNFLSIDDHFNFKINNNMILDPFGKNSLFNHLYLNNGYLLHYGSKFSTSTIIHFVERMANRLLYRYDKLFDIVIINESKKINVKLNYHVRPKYFDLTYDWNKIEDDLVAKNMLDIFVMGRTQIKGVKIKNLVNFWLKNLNADPYYFVDIPTKQRIKEKLKCTNCSLKIDDFE